MWMVPARGGTISLCVFSEYICNSGVYSVLLQKFVKLYHALAR